MQVSSFPPFRTHESATTRRIGLAELSSKHYFPETMFAPFSTFVQLLIDEVDFPASGAVGGAR